MSDTNEHRLSLSYQIRRAIKAEDALTVAQKEIEKLSGLLNAAYVSREEKEKQYDEALCVVAEQRDTLKLHIRQHLANRYAYMFKEFCEELEEILYAPPVTAAKQAQPELRVIPTAQGVFPVWFDGAWRKSVYKYGTDYGTGIALYAAPIPQQPEPSVPEGWKLVPIEPTEAMLEVGFFAENDVFDSAKTKRIHAWKDMIAAAPQPKETK